MGYLDQIQKLNTMLLKEMPEYQSQAGAFPLDITSRGGGAV